VSTLSYEHEQAHLRLYRIEFACIWLVDILEISLQLALTNLFPSWSILLTRFVIFLGLSLKPAPEMRQGISPTLLYPVPSPEEHPIIALLIKSIRDYYPLWQASTLVFTLWCRGIVVNLTSSLCIKPACFSLGLPSRSAALRFRRSCYLDQQSYSS